ncbi:MAG TPA: nuclease [Desulfobulbaceae bacterium]|nr:nuclease [Desulfobulbaceae bacterium]
MKKGFFCSVCIVFLILAADRALGWEGVVVKVLDGDSLRVQREGRLVEIRLYGIDAPEYRQAYSNRARQRTRELLYRQTVAVEEKDVDRYGRIVALVSCQGLLINRELVRSGLAWHYSKYCRSQPLCRELAALEQGARSAGIGLWADPEPVAPWEWKQRQGSGSRGKTGWFSRFLDWW